MTNPTVEQYEKLRAVARKLAGMAYMNYMSACIRGGDDYDWFDRYLRDELSQEEAELILSNPETINNDQKI